MNALKPPISDAMCQNRTKTVERCDFCILTIPCHCVILTDINKFLPHVITCDSDKQDIT